MNTHTSWLKHVSPKVAGLRGARRARGLAVVALVVAPALFPQTAPRAQRAKEEGASLKGVSASRQGGETTVSITGEGAMNRVQTWQDAEGFHVVFPNGKGAPGRLPKGVKTQRVGNSLELVVPTRPGASVTVQPGAGRLDLVVSGDLDEGSGATEATPAASAPAKSPRAETRERAAVEEQEQQQRRAEENAARQTSEAEDRATQKRDEPAAAGGNSSERPNASEGGAPTAAQAATAANSDTIPNPNAAPAPPPLDATKAAAQTKIDARGGDSSFLSATGLLVLLSVAGLGGGLYFVRRRRASGASGGISKDKKAKKEKEKKSNAPAKQDALVKVEAAKPVEPFELPPPFEHTMGDRRRGSVPVAQDRRRSGAGATDVGLHYNLTASGLLAPDGTAGEPARKPGAATQWSTPTVLFGAYRIEQEVCKLVQGQPHSIDVLASRATDDRRAIETSLVKALNSHETGEDGHWRVRQALEDYGFVARQSASLLLSNDAYERVSAARVLGQIKSAASLPFLLEALYDMTPVVRTEVVATLGSLGLPRAIGALIDMARRYPEVPESLIAPALTACSFEAQEWAWNALTDGRANDITGEHSAGGPSRPDSWVGVEELPEWLEAESLADAIEHLESADMEARISAAQSLAQYPARRSVDALTAILVRDENPAVRAAAVTSLAAIDHETVFAPVLYALADEAREVRAAAARAYSGATYDRADASARLAETGDRETLEDLARACVKSGMAAQAVGRLASEDGRQAYEAFSMLSLVVRGGETAPVIETVAGHRDMSVRLAAVRLACLTGDAGLLKSLRELAASGRLPENLRAAILDASEQNAQTHR
ncbi:MAG TPA: HEAT repeat domain-containing protein [Pyrinomonadaceae bacterium]